MKHLKMSFVLLLTVAFFTSCEKESTILPENMEVKNENIEVNSFKSLFSIKESGIDIERYINSFPNKISKTTKHNFSQRPEDTGLQFYYSKEEFPCTNLPTEDFEEGNLSEMFFGPFEEDLNENTDNDVFSPGDILSGVNITSDFLYSEESFFALIGEDFEEGEFGNSSKILLSIPAIIIDFMDNNITNVSMELFRIQPESYEAGIAIAVIGDSDEELLGYSIINTQSAGAFLGIKATQPIKAILIMNEELFFELTEGNFPGGTYEGENTDLGEESIIVGIDNLSFGDCNPDNDEDGVLNEDDEHPNSNISEEISFDGCYPGVTNAVFSNGFTMADEVEDLIAEIWAKLNSDNVSRYYDAQKDFQREMTYLLAKWYRTDRVITDREKYNIVKCVRSSRFFEIVPM